MEERKAIHGRTGTKVPDGSYYLKQIRLHAIPKPDLLVICSHFYYSIINKSIPGHPPLAVGLWML